MYLNFNKIAFFLTVFVACFVSSCKNTNTENFSDEEIISNYHEAYFPEKLTKEQNFALYLDFSGSIKTAFKDFNTQNFYQLFINSMKIQTVDFYAVSNSGINKTESFKTSELLKTIKDSGKFKGGNSPVDKAVKQIISENSEAVLITDDELFQSSKDFEQWLKDGNAIDFFITECNEKKSKPLFYICFVPKNSLSSVTKDFLSFLSNSGTAKTMKYNHFYFSNGCLDSGIGYLELYEDWKTLFQKYSDKNGNSLPGGIKLNIPENYCYTIGKIVLKTYNISEDFLRYKNTLSDKTDTVFVPAKRLSGIENLFVLDNDNPNNELKIKMSQNFSGSLSASENNLLRVDFVLKDVSTETKNIENLPVVNALKATNPEGRTVYTYYIKTPAYK
ncbi:MAG: hypothetical protein II956_16540 [Bacteroidales bacterium]|nr:hypothetical protein [Bacteroidales bacterium]